MSLPAPTAAEIEAAIRNIPDFPKPGIQFKDITPVLANNRLFNGAIAELAGRSSPAA
jgi:adenine phosphoribosyltransferase